MDTECKRISLLYNIVGSYDYRLETSIQLDDEKINGKNEYTIKLLEDKITYIDKCIKTNKKELEEL